MHAPLSHCWLPIGYAKSLCAGSNKFYSIHLKYDNLLIYFIFLLCGGSHGNIFQGEGHFCYHGDSLPRKWSSVSTEDQHGEDGALLKWLQKLGTISIHSILGNGCEGSQVG